jgi:hypothetical protein
MDRKPGGERVEKPVETWSLLSKINIQKRNGDDQMVERGQGDEGLLSAREQALVNWLLTEERKAAT